MIDLEDLGGAAFSREYAVMVDAIPTETGALLVAKHEGDLISLPVEADAEISVITYSVSNMLETDQS